MKGISKYLSVFLIIVLCIVSMTGCKDKERASDPDPQEKQPTKEDDVLENSEDKSLSEELLFWHTYSDTEEEIFNDEVIEEFKTQYPNIKLEIVRMPYEGLKQQVITAVAGDASPDLMRMDIIWVPEFAKMGALENVDDRDDFERLKDSVFEGAMDTNLYNGKYYGLPLNTNTKIAIYNKKLMGDLGITEPPRTFDELIGLSEQLKKQGEDVWGIGIGGTGVWGMLPYFWTLGGKVTDENYSEAIGYLNSVESINALEEIVDLYDKGIIGPCILGEEPGTWGGIESNNYLMIDDGPWYFSMQKDTNIDELVVASELPTRSGGSVSVIGGENLVMFKNSKSKDAAWSMMKYLLSVKPQIAMSKSGLIPTVKEAAQAESVVSNPIMQVYVKQLETAKPRIPHPKGEEMFELIELAFEKAIRGEASAKELLDDAALKVNQLLQDD